MEMKEVVKRIDKIGAECMKNKRIEDAVALSIASGLAAMQLSEKVEIRRNCRTEYFTCPGCGKEQIWDGYAKCCSRCGQRIEAKRFRRA